MLTWDLTIFGNIIGNKDRGEVMPRTWFHSYFSRKKSELLIAFTFFEKWKVKNKNPSLFFEKWKWNWNGSRSRTRSENEKKLEQPLNQSTSEINLPSRKQNVESTPSSGGLNNLIRRMTGFGEKREQEDNEATKKDQIVQIITIDSSLYLRSKKLNI